ncbi:MAG TPA: hypothetical protein VLM38_05390 [Blastocatellia bacterium]|nr:hypothetical protein [Blastocatellia bacterium]
MKHHMIRYGMVILLAGLAASQANAGQSSREQHIELISYSFGCSQGQTGRISITLARSGKLRLSDDSVSARIQLLDTEGEVIAESDKIKVAPGQTRYWDVARDLLPASGEPGGRLQLRARILVTTLSADLDPQTLMPTIEVIDTITGSTIYQAGKRFLIFVQGPQ